MTAAAPTPPPPPNWYLDPHDSAQQRWWSGQDWTGYTRSNLPDPHARTPYTPYTPIVQLPVITGGATTRLRKTNGIGFAGAVVGLGSLIINPLCLASLTGIVLSIIGLVNDENRRHEGKPVGGRGWIIAGLIAGVLSTLFWGIYMVQTIIRVQNGQGF